jgi:hypothetical protein
MNRTYLNPIAKIIGVMICLTTSACTTIINPSLKIVDVNGNAVHGAIAAVFPYKEVSSGWHGSRPQYENAFQLEHMGDSWTSKQLLLTYRGAAIVVFAKGYVPTARRFEGQTSITLQRINPDPKDIEENIGNVGYALRSIYGFSTPCLAKHITGFLDAALITLNSNPQSLSLNDLISLISSQCFIFSR